jgi:hypothetical protein
LHEGLSILAPFSEAYREALGGKADAMRSGYLQACERAATAPDAALLEHVARSLDDEQDREDAGSKDNARSESPSGGGAIQDEVSAPPKAKRSWWPFGGKG